MPHVIAGSGLRPSLCRAAPGGGPATRGRRRRGLPTLAALLALTACAELAPLQRPPLNPTDDAALVTTREEALHRFGPPIEIRTSDVGQVLVYRRAVVVDVNPNRYYGEDSGDRLNRYERVLLYLDTDGRVVRRAVERE